MERIIGGTTIGWSGDRFALRFHPSAKRRGTIMRGLQANVTRGLVLLGSLAILGGGALGQDTPKPPAAASQAAKPQEKTVAFEMRDKPWPQILEWLYERSGLPVATRE